MRFACQIEQLALEHRRAAVIVDESKIALTPLLDHKMRSDKSPVCGSSQIGTYGVSGGDKMRMSCCFCAEPSSLVPMQSTAI